MKRVCHWSLTCLISLAPFTQLSAEALADDLRLLLDKAVSSSRTLNYHGTVIYSHDERIDTLRVVHSHSEKGEYERLSTLTGKPSEVVRRDGQIFYRFADRQGYGAYQAEDGMKQLIARVSREFEALSAVYRFGRFDAERVAGRETQGVVVMPQDQYRYGCRLWIDKDSGLVLKSQIIGKHGAVETLMFTEIEYANDQLADRFSPGSPQSEQVVSKSWLLKTQETNWLPKWMPAGFHAAATLMREQRGGGIVSRRVVLSDGMTMVSIFIEPVSGPVERKEVFTRKGATTGFSTVAGGHRVTAVGEVPPVTVQRIAQSLPLH